MNPKLQHCYDAFERLKLNNGTQEGCTGLPLNEITFSKISQEAGLDSGYLKKNRENHQPLLSILTLFQEDLKKSGTTMSKGAAIQREKDNLKVAKDEKKSAEIKLEASLGRELQLYHKLKEVEQENIELKKQLAQFSNVTHLPM